MNNNHIKIYPYTTTSSQQENEPTLILVCIGNYQEYILINIRNLLYLNHTNIYVIINAEFKPYFLEFNNNNFVKLINVEELKDEFHYYEKTTLNKSFRNGFWALTTVRLFYIYALMKKMNLTNVIHLENDVIIYYNCNTLIENIDTTKIYIPFDKYLRNIISIIYIPNSDILQIMLQNYNTSLIDMATFAPLKKQFPNLIENLPICVPLNGFNQEQLFVSKNFNTFQFIFDGIAIGQYLGGIDPRNTLSSSSSTIGFINETCCINYSNFTFIWKTSTTGNIYKRPFLKIPTNNNNTVEIPIFNLHVHSKNLQQFLSI